MFELGDFVYLKSIPQSLTSHTYHKLHPKLHGPFEVVEKIGALAIILKLPETTKVHPVFLVSCLEKHLGPNVNLCQYYELF